MTTPALRSPAGKFLPVALVAAAVLLAGEAMGADRGKRTKSGDAIKTPTIDTDSRQKIGTTGGDVGGNTTGGGGAARTILTRWTVVF